MTLNEWAKEIRALADAKGFRDDIKHPTDGAAVLVYVANLHGEASELWEAARKGTLRLDCDKADDMRKVLGLSDGQAPNCAEEEVADMIIRALDIANVFDVDVDSAVESSDVLRAVNALGMSCSDVGVFGVADMASAYHAAVSHITVDVSTGVHRQMMSYRLGVLLNIAFHIAHALDVDWREAIATKHAYNKTRPFRHGGKLV